MTAAPSGALTAEGLGYTAHGGARLVDGLSLAVTPGERLAIIGPNGAGKTTLLRLLAGRLSASSGSVTIDGRPLARMRRAERAQRIAVLAQGDNADGRLSVSEYVMLGRVPHLGTAPRASHAEMVARAMSRCGLDGLTRRPLSSLSGGERQRAAFARALAQDPSILFLDEPTNNLDPRARFDFLAMARNLGITVIAVLHDLPLVLPFADRVAVMAGGRLVAHDRPKTALGTRTVRSVFQLDVVSVAHPDDGRPLMFFEPPTVDAAASHHQGGPLS